MKKFWFFVLLVVFLTTTICTAGVPSLVGKWTGSWSGYDNGKGFTKSENESIRLTVLAQENRIFAGNLIVKLENETELRQDFAGAIGLDNKTLYIAEFFKGYSLGTIVSSDEIELIYLADGKNGSAAIDNLYRIE